MKRFRHAFTIAVLTVAAAAAMPAATAAWDAGAFVQAGPAVRDGGGIVSVQQKGGGGERGADRGERDRNRGREGRQERHEDRRGDRMSEDDRRSLHRDLDKANRELYGRRVPK